MVPAMVAGFQVPENVRYHAGHTWALSESRELVRVGMDDFASKLIGKIDSIALPQRGRWVRQGQKIWTIFRDGKSVDMVSPIEGTVTDINEAVMKESGTGAQRSLRRRLAADRAGSRLQDQLPQPDGRHAGPPVDGILRAPAAQQNADGMAGALAQDGGVAVDDITAHLPGEDWATVTKEFFLS